MGIIFLVIGLIIGSFLNAVIFRLKSGASFATGRSKCPQCKKTLSSYDLVPLLSYLWLWGKCRHCRAKISFQYPLVEGLTALAFVLVGGHHDFLLKPELVRDLVFASVFMVVAVYDFKHFLILDRVVFPWVIVALASNLILDLSNNCGLASLDCHTLSGLLGAFVASAFFLVQFGLSQGRWIGLGDVKFAILLGLVLGWPMTLVALFLAYVLGALVGLGLIAAGRKKMTSKVPFGSFLSAAAILVMIYGPNLLDWYLNMIGY